MGIFSEADQHPFAQTEADGVEKSHGGAATEPWLDDTRMHEHRRPADLSRRQLFIRDDQVA